MASPFGLNRKEGAPECIKDGKGKGYTEENQVEPPKINIVGDRIDHAIVKDRCSTIEQEGTELLKDDGHIAFKGGDRIPEIDP